MVVLSVGRRWRGAGGGTARLGGAPRHDGRDGEVSCASLALLRHHPRRAAPALYIHQPRTGISPTYAPSTNAHYSIFNTTITGMQFSFFNQTLVIVIRTVLIVVIYASGARWTDAAAERGLARGAARRAGRGAGRGHHSYPDQHAARGDDLPPHTASFIKLFNNNIIDVVFSSVVVRT